MDYNEGLNKIKQLIVGKTIFLENRIVYTVRKITNINVIEGLIFIEIEDKKGNIVDINLNNVIKMEDKKD